ncbi:MAG: PhzF family phenazine biosynthesis protein [Xanthomonadaceae bacterium]|nr:PhzF family phenazine biosynthesis protein [Xanthomonadaceae bacterium]
MTETLEFETWDVFTDQRFAGNPLAVVFDADRLSAASLLAITREFNYSESVFVLQSDVPGCHARIRIFTPAGELPFAGHPTVGAACAIARRDSIDQSMRLELDAGIFPIRLGPRPTSKHAARLAEFENPNLPRLTGTGPVAGQVEAALSLPAGSVATGAGSPARASAGIEFIYARASLEHVRRASLEPGAWNALEIGDACGLLLYAEGGDSAESHFHARMFGPHIGVPEDPATGSAAAALPAHVLTAAALPDGPHQWLVEQGFEMGRPSQIRVAFELRAGEFQALRVSGQAVPVLRGTLSLSD